MANFMSQRFHGPFRSRWRDVCYNIDYTKLQTVPLEMAAVKMNFIESDQL